MAHTFIVSDESINSYGFVIRTAGIDTTGFSKNPVMFYQHERKSGVIGRWDNIRVSGTQLLADAVFDENTPLGREVQQRVESGFIRSASIGIGNVRKEFVNGTETVVGCELMEISIVDIPANRNAVKLFRKGGKCVYTLSELEAGDGDDLRRQIIALLGLQEDATDAEILDNINSLLNSPESPEQSVNNAVQMGFIDRTEAASYTAMARSNPTAFRGLIADKRTTQKKALADTLVAAIRKGKIIPQDRHLFETVGECMGANAVRRIIDCIPERVRLMDLIDGAHKNRANWKLADYRKYAPEELRNNPSLYAQLLEKEGREMELNAETLDYYRRNKPEYLAAHPEEYQRLINNKQSV